MIYTDESQRIRDMEDLFKSETSPFRMAVVTSIINGRPVIRMNGETVDSSKKYKYLSSYVPSAGDYVLLAVTSRTYVILGKVV